MHHNLESVDQVSNQNIYFVLCFFVCVVRGCVCFALLLNRKQYQILFCYHILLLSPLCYEGPIQSGFVGLKCYCHAKFYALQNQIYKIDLFR